MITFDEKRSCERYSIRCMVTIEKREGWLRDISATGIYFLLPYKIELQQQVNMIIHFVRKPPMQCSGKVIRIEEHPSGYGVAARLTDLAITT